MDVTVNAAEPRSNPCALIDVAGDAASSGCETPPPVRLDDGASNLGVFGRYIARVTASLTPFDDVLSLSRVRGTERFMAYRAEIRSSAGARIPLTRLNSIQEYGRGTYQNGGQYG
jgi:hypothetical protein